MLNQNNYPSLDDPAPRAVRWATKLLQREFTPAWSKWHLTDGNGSFTACGVRVVPFIVDGSPQERGPNRLTCRRCAAISARRTPTEPPAAA